MSKQILAILLILALVMVTACAPPVEEAKTVDAEESAVSEDIDEVTSIEEDLDTSSMDSLDQDLAEISW